MSRFPVIAGTGDGTTVVELSGEIDLLSVPQITKCLDAVTKGRHPRLIVDLRGVSFIDCRGLSVLVRARRRVKERAGTLCLVTRDARILSLLRATELLPLFTVRPDRVSAEKAVAEGAHNPVASA